MKMMQPYYRRFYLILVLLVMLVFIPYKFSAPAASDQQKLGNFVVNPLIRYGKYAPVCSAEVHGYARCHARVVVDSNASPFITGAPTGYGPAQFLGAYKLPSSASSNPGPIIAIVDAYDQPHIQSDLNTYSSTFGIPTLPACNGSKIATSTVVPCFLKVNQNGAKSYPSADTGWGLEISLDVEVAHAICQNCSIVLVEAYSPSYSNLMAAVDQAVAQGAAVISNSYGSDEFSGETYYDSHFTGDDRKGIAFTFSSGDSGYGTSYPAASQYVTAVGGTTLNINSNNSYQSESAWSGSGSGCSAYEPQPSWQKTVNPSMVLCSKRIIADVSADANPNTGAAVYDSYGYTGWLTVGGTSLSSPIIAGIYALAGGVSSTTQGNSIPYDNYSNYLHDTTSGSNGSCGGTYLCTSMSGFDGPTGLGTPNGTGAFTLTPISTPPPTPTPSPTPTPTPTPPPSDTTPPQIKITKPFNRAMVFGNVTIMASASDNVGVKEVDFYIDGQLLAMDTLSPYSFIWNSSTASRGSHTIKAVATDTSGNTASSQITVYR